MNGEKIEKIKRTEEKLYIEWENEDYIDLLLIDFEAVKTINKLIKTIVTKEQFSSLEYII